MAHQIVRTDMTTQQIGVALAKSGYFEDAKSEAQAIVKVLAGQELGFGPIASMTGIHVIKGKIAVGANLMAAAVKRSGKYNYRVLELSEQVCELVFFEAGQEVGRSKFTAADAVKAQTQNMNKFPKNMLFARAMSNGVKWYTPDVFLGAPVYTPEELGATIDEDDNVISVPAERIHPAPTVRTIDEIVASFEPDDDDEDDEPAPPAKVYTPAQRQKMISTIRDQMRELDPVFTADERRDNLTRDLETLTTDKLITIGLDYKARMATPPF